MHWMQGMAPCPAQAATPQWELAAGSSGPLPSSRQPQFTHIAPSAPPQLRANCIHGHGSGRHGPHKRGGSGSPLPQLSPLLSRPPAAPMGGTTQHRAPWGRWSSRARWQRAAAAACRQRWRRRHRHARVPGRPGGRRRGRHQAAAAAAATERAAGAARGGGGARLVGPSAECQPNFCAAAQRNQRPQWQYVPRFGAHHPRPSGAQCE